MPGAKRAAWLFFPQKSTAKRWDPQQQSLMTASNSGHYHVSRLQVLQSGRARPAEEKEHVSNCLPRGVLS